MRNSYLCAMIGCGVLIAGVLGFSPFAVAQDLSADPGLKPTAPSDPHRSSAQDLIASASPSLTVTLVGSLLLNSPAVSPPVFDAPVRALLDPGGQNVTIGTLQGPLIDVPGVVAYPYAWGDAPVLRAAKSTAAFLKSQGFSGLMQATAHALDWGVEGMRSTNVALDEAGIAHAGTGDSLGLAAHANYIDQPAGGGRIALVSASTSFRPTSNAVAPHGIAPGRPGVNGVDVSPIRLVSSAQVDHLQHIACRFQNPGDPAACAKLESRPTVSALGSTFRAEADSARWGSTEYQFNIPQANSVLSNIRGGKQQSDFLLAAVDVGSAPQAPTYLTRLLHAAIDAGADTAFATGGGELGPIELYRRADGRIFPVFYGLGNFAWTGGLAPPATAPARFDGVIVRCATEGNSAVINIYPLDLSTGWPRLANRARATAIINHLRTLSSSYGTQIDIHANGATVVGKLTYPLTAGGKAP
jgi:poly-gamma-glutamate capsule biosynthesis protein CapA/YwtB (metallophosphatase superfamily)